jgi:hypothetical protein
LSLAILKSRWTVTQLDERPNLLLIVADQERAPMHWPERFVEERLR